MKKTLLYHLKKNKIDIKADCNGLWGCCKCKIKSESFKTISSNEENLLSEEELKNNIRLACEQYIEEKDFENIKNSIEIIKE